ncbi:MAG: DUF1376 domain-containing protein [Acidobacteria bacterium]|nr:DUF1376 domain-containing protein [Acidobacteriota bacterium]
MNYYKRHLGDYAKNTRTLSTYEHGVYNLVLDLYYTDESPVSTEDAYAVCRADSAKDRASVDRVLSKFFTQDGAVWHHGRVDEEIAKYREKAEKNRGFASLGGKQKAKRNASETLSETPENRLANDTPSHKPIANSHKKAKEDTPTAVVFDGVPDQVIADFRKLRQAKKAAITQTAIDGIAREARKAGLSLSQAMAMCCERGWAGFKAEWVKSDPGDRPAKARRQL